MSQGTPHRLEHSEAFPFWWRHRPLFKAKHRLGVRTKHSENVVLCSQAKDVAQNGERAVRCTQGQHTRTSAKALYIASAPSWWQGTQKLPKRTQDAISWHSRLGLSTDCARKGTRSLHCIDTQNGRFPAAPQLLGPQAPAAAGTSRIVD